MSEMLSEHFSRAELACHCGCGTIPGPKFIERLEGIRNEYGAPMIVTSGARCPEHNRRVASTGDTGPHVITPERFESGEGAVDVLVSGPNTLALQFVAYGWGFRGFGFYQHGPHRQRWLHLDNVWNSVVVPRPAVWTYHGT